MLTEGLYAAMASLLLEENWVEHSLQQRHPQTQTDTTCARSPGQRPDVTAPLLHWLSAGEPPEKAAGYEVGFSPNPNVGCHRWPSAFARMLRTAADICWSAKKEVAAGRPCSTTMTLAVGRRGLVGGVAGGCCSMWLKPKSEFWTSFGWRTMSLK